METLTEASRMLDYINDGDPETTGDLGAGCIWLMPMAQSPSYHAYDVTNYYAVERDYGTEADFRELVRESERRGIRILFDLVLNHTASEHPYFKDALLRPGFPVPGLVHLGGRAPGDARLAGAHLAPEPAP
jgi:alpha-amylase